MNKSEVRQLTIQFDTEEFPDNKSLKIELHTSNTLSSVAELLRNRGINNLEMSCNGAVCSAKLPIESLTAPYIVTVSKVKPKLRLLLFSIEAKEVEISYNGLMEIGELVAIASRQLGSSDLIAYFAGKRLRPSHTLRDYNIQQDSRVYLLSPDTYILDGFGDQRIPVNFPPATKISAAKRKISSMVPNLPEKFDLLWFGKKLKDSLAFENYKIGFPRLELAFPQSSSGNQANEGSIEKQCGQVITTAEPVCFNANLNAVRDIPQQTAHLNIEGEVPRGIWRQLVEAINNHRIFELTVGPENLGLIELAIPQLKSTGILHLKGELDVWKPRMRKLASSTALVKIYFDWNIDYPAELRLSQSLLELVNTRAHPQIKQPLTRNINRANKLLLACADNDVGKINDLLKNSQVSVHAFDEDNNTALHIAAKSGSTEVIKLLLENGASPYALNNNGFTPEEVAGIYQQTWAQVVLSHLGNITDEQQHQILKQISTDLNRLVAPGSIT